MEHSVLQDIRVIDFSHSWAAPHCARLLADFGAEVIKVEYIKRLCLLRGARKQDKIYNTHSAWQQVNRNKLGITLDLHVEEDRQTFRELVRTSDVLIENSRPGVMDRFGFGYKELAEVNKKIIMLSMSAFGNTGPFSTYAGYGAVFEAMSGMQSLTAYSKNGPPQRIREMDITNGVMGSGAVMTALLHRRKTGRGQHIDLSQLEAATHATIGEHLLGHAAGKQQSPPLANRHRYFAPQGCYPCRGEDKWIVITIRSDDEWQRFCRVMGQNGLASDGRFETNADRHKHHDVLDDIIASLTKNHGNAELMHILQNEKIPAAAVLNMKEIAEDPHLRERRYFSADVAGSGKTFMGLPFRLSRGAGAIKWRGPDLGEHNTRIFKQIGPKSASSVEPIPENEIRTAFDVD